MSVNTEYEEYINSHPVVQSTNTGRYGFGRWGDGVNLHTLIYKTRERAERAREIKWQLDQDCAQAIAAGVDPRYTPTREKLELELTALDRDADSLIR